MALNENVSILSKVLKVMNNLSYKLVFLFLIVMTVLITIDIILRSFFGLSIDGTTEINEYILVIIGFLGLAQTQANKGHISVDLIFDRLSSSKKYFIHQINNIILILFCILFIYAGTKKAISAFAGCETNWFGVYILPVWYIRWIVVIGFAMLFLQLVKDIFQTKKNSRYFD